MKTLSRGGVKVQAKCSWRNKSECLIDGKYSMQNTIYNGTVTVTPSVSQRAYMRIAEGGSKQ